MCLFKITFRNSSYHYTNTGNMVLKNLDVQCYIFLQQKNPETQGSSSSTPTQWETLSLLRRTRYIYKY